MTENTNKIMELYAFATNNGITINEITVTEESSYKKNRIGENMMMDWYKISINDLRPPEQQTILGMKINTIKTF